MSAPRPLVAMGYVVAPDGKHVALLKKNRPEYLQGLWMGVVGKVDEGETPLQAVRREVFEESSLDIDEWKFIKVIENPERPCDIHVFFAVHDLTHAKTMTDEEVRVTRLDDLEGMRFANSFLEIKDLLLEYAAEVETSALQKLQEIRVELRKDNHRGE